MKFTMLWTDYFIYLLLAMGIFGVFKIFDDPRLLKKWRSLFYRPLTLVSAMVLGIYLVIGLLDTIHLKVESDGKGAKTGVVSVLDKILAPIANHMEKTYSAPFATHSFNKENIVLANGKIVRDFPRLQYGGAHLKNPSLKKQDILQRFKQLALQSLLLWLAFCVVMLILGCRKHRLSWEVFFSKVIKGQTHFPWRSFLATSGIMLFVILFFAAFMPYYHIFGTSEVGQDVLYESLKSIRTGLTIGTLTTLVMLPFAVILGVMAGYFKGWVDDIIQYIYTTLSSIPGVLLIAAAVLSLQIYMDRHAEWFQTSVHRADARLFALCAILGVASWAGLCRLLRGETLKISQMDYVYAAHTLGVSHFKTLLRHILPNVFHLILITIVLDFSGLVLAEAVLSYVGVGVDPTSFSWGTMINGARMELARIPVIWWSLVAAFIFMFILVLAANLFSDAIRDAFDPRIEAGGPL
jgi:peptide/nickel transport system permease protein